MWPFNRKKQETAAPVTPASGDFAEKLACQILPLANYFAKRYFRVILGRDAGKGDDEMLFLLARETLYFSTHLAGRIASKVDGEQASRTFLDRIRQEMYRLLFAVQPGAERIQFSDYAAALETGWSRAAAENDKFPLQLAKNESDLMEGTLLWEFSKRLLTVAQASNTDSISATLQIAIELGDAVPKTMGVRTIPPPTSRQTNSAGIVWATGKSLLDVSSQLGGVPKTRWRPAGSISFSRSTVPNRSFNTSSRNS